MQIKVGSVKDISDGKMHVFNIDGIKVSVAMAGGQLYAFDDTCTHRGCSLAKGKLEGTTVICPCHGSQFDVTSGRVIHGPATQPVRSLVVEVKGDDLLIES